MTRSIHSSGQAAHRRSSVPWWLMALVAAVTATQDGCSRCTMDRTPEKRQPVFEGCPHLRPQVASLIANIREHYVCFSDSKGQHLCLSNTSGDRPEGLLAGTVRGLTYFQRPFARDREGYFSIEGTNLAPGKRQLEAASDSRIKLTCGPRSKVFQRLDEGAGRALLSWVKIATPSARIYRPLLAKTADGELVYSHTVAVAGLTHCDRVYTGKPPRLRLRKIARRDYMLDGGTVVFTLEHGGLLELWWDAHRGLVKEVKYRASTGRPLLKIKQVSLISQKAILGTLRTPPPYQAPPYRPNAVCAMFGLSQ